MTIALSGREIAEQLAKQFPEAIVDSNELCIIVRAEGLLQIAQFLRISPEFDFNYLTSVTAVDYIDYIDVVYRLTSLRHNQSLVLKARCHNRDNPTLPSVVGLWRGADMQEREVYDLMGVSFSGHPNLKRILLWDGFQGHPLRRDYL